jgi:hypothetical protein
VPTFAPEAQLSRSDTALLSGRQSEFSHRKFVDPPTRGARTFSAPWRALWVSFPQSVLPPDLPLSPTWVFEGVVIRRNGMESTTTMSESLPVVFIIVGSSKKTSFNNSIWNIHVHHSFNHPLTHHDSGGELSSHVIKSLVE